MSILISLVVIILFSLVCLSAYTHSITMAEYARKNYEWYKSTHPQLVKNNRVSCFRCNHNRIHVRGLMQRTYVREHFCVQCGETLYYSPEKR